MKFWNKAKYSLLIALITAIFILLRVLIQASDVMTAILILPILISQDLFHSNYVIPDIIVLFTAVISIILVPAPGESSRTRRYFLRPVLAVVLIFVVSNPTIDFVKEQKEILEDQRQAENVAHAYQLIEEADEIFYYNLSTHYHLACSDIPTEIKHCCGHGHDMILIDYDTHSVTFLQSPEAAGKIDTFILPLVETEVAEHQIQVDIPLSAPGARFLTYYPDYDQPHRTCGITLVMADGSIYALTNLVEPTSGYVRFLALHANRPVADPDSCPYGD